MIPISQGEFYHHMATGESYDEPHPELVDLYRRLENDML